MGTLVSTIVAKLYMEHFERTALRTATTAPRLWLRYVDGTFVIQQEEHKLNFLEHINNVDPAIKFTVETNQQYGAIPFLDTIVKPQADNTLSLTVYRKPMHTDQYLQWDSHHHLSAKCSVISTLTHRARTVCTKPELLNQEIQHLRKALTKCKYPKWALDKIERFISNNQEESNKGNNLSGQSGSNNDNNSRDPEGRGTTKDRYTKGHIVIPYTQGLGESIKTYARDMGSRPISRVIVPSRTY